MTVAELRALLAKLDDNTDISIVVHMQDADCDTYGYDVHDFDVMIYRDDGDPAYLVESVQIIVPFEPTGGFLVSTAEERVAADEAAK